MKRTCSVDRCDRKAEKRGWCGMHYQRWRKTGTTEPRPIASLAQRLWPKVDVRGPDECWPWKAGARHRFGYGVLTIYGRYVSAHVLAWELANGPVPDGLLVRHSCDNPPCCNPAHLLVGTHRDNYNDMIARNRRGPVRPSGLRGEAHGCARLTEADVREIRRRFVSGERPAAIAPEFGISTSHASGIAHRRFWAHVT